MKHFNVSFKPDNRHISIHAGATILEAASQVGIILNTVCGGKGTCKKCAVNLGPKGKEVLACQYHIESDLTVTIPVSSRFFEQKILAEGISKEAQTESDIYRDYTHVAEGGRILGVAVDIGTTTVVAKLMDMTTGLCLATEADLNPQSRFGDDVISRIAYADTDAKLTELQAVIVHCLNELITNFFKKAAFEAGQIFEACVVGNTTMNHIFVRLPIKQLGHAPYNAHSLEAHDCAPKEIGLHMNNEGNIHTVENIAGFVGSDTTAVALAVDIDSAEETTLVVDIGTNGELLLANGDKLHAASCAAGPAFEGARIKYGSRAVEGAIEAVVVNEDDIDVDVIGDSPARSICGSGLIDAVAVLLDLGIVDATGRFVEKSTLQDKLAPAIFSRLCEVDDQPAFVLAGPPAGGKERVILTQADIRQVQLAKAAVRAGITLLQQKLGLEDDDIERILLAGAFGNYIRRESALRIGLLPSVSAERIQFVGNAASAGAQMILLSRHYRYEAKRLAGRIKYVEIAHEPDFQEVFVNSMSF
jgi:uncharacterized 2Fe-2S/4Fe-4S cluster protein (DUF4445 family)